VRDPVFSAAAATAAVTVTAAAAIAAAAAVAAAFSLKLQRLRSVLDDAQAHHAVAQEGSDLAGPRVVLGSVELDCGRKRRRPMKEAGVR